MRGAPANVILLAAGRGSRLAPLTDATHKSLLPMGGRPVLGYVLEEVLARPVQEVIVVTGDKRESIEAFVGTWNDDRIRLVHNARFAEDTNILSTAMGVDVLRRRELGYLIVETDLVMEREGWQQVLDIAPDDPSFWVTRGRYGTALTGGALHTDASGAVDGLVYAPTYDVAYEGWAKLVGLLYVGRGEVTEDCALRRAALERSIRQYYMTPWVENLARLPCRARSLDGLFAGSFNDFETYRRVADELASVKTSAIG